MADDDKKVPLRLYEQRLRFTPNGTQFSNQVTKEGRDHFNKLHQEKMVREAADDRKKTIGEEFKKVGRITVTSKTKFKRAAKKDRDDFER
jgi:hypothetical protein